MTAGRKGLFAGAAALLLAGCSVTTSTMPLTPSKTASPAISAAPTPTPSGGLTIPVDAPQPTAHIPPVEHVVAMGANTLPANKTATIWVCVGPSLLSPVGSQVQVQVVNAEHVRVYSQTAPLPFARAISIVPGKYVASVVDLNSQGGRTQNTIGSKAAGQLSVGQYVYLVGGNSCPQKSHP